MDVDSKLALRACLTHLCVDQTHSYKEERCLYITPPPPFCHITLVMYLHFTNTYGLIFSYSLISYMVKGHKRDLMRFLSMLKKIQEGKMFSWYIFLRFHHPHLRIVFPSKS